MANVLSTLNITDTIFALEIALQSDTPILLNGPPGVGKSAIVEQVARKMDYPLETLILSQCEPADVGGVPVVDNGALDRKPWGAIKRACEQASILFLDELSCAHPSVQGAALQLVYNRCAGDQRLHPDTRIVCATNPPDQAAGGNELALPMISRLFHIYMRPEILEISRYFASLGKPGSTLRDLASDFAATLAVSQDLVAIEPPPGASATGRPWAAPRSWERGLVFCAKCIDRGIQEFTTDEKKSKKLNVNPIFMAGLAGNVGDDVAMSWWSIRKIRKGLPTEEQIVANPDKCPVPDPSEVDKNIAICGILGKMCNRHPCEAWTYAIRVKNPDVRNGLFSVMGTSPEGAVDNYQDNKWYASAKKAQQDMVMTLLCATK